MTMIQQEIKFFWPLTEQIPLDLIYEDYKEPTPHITPGTYLVNIVGPGTTGSFISSQFTINCDRVRFQTTKKHTFIQKLMHKAMGIKVYESNSN